MDTEKIRREVRSWLVSQGLTIEKAAEKIPMSAQGLRNVLNGSKPIGPGTARKMAEAFGFSATYLLTGDGSLLPGKGQEHTPDGRGIFISRDKLIEWIDNLTGAVNIQAQMLERWQDSPSKPRLLSHNQTNKN